MNRVLCWVFIVSLWPAAAVYPETTARDQWEEEILLQISELRKSQGELAREISELKAGLQSLRRENATQPERKVSLDLSDGSLPALGDTDAAVAIVEFSDFECPFCLRHNRNTTPLLKSKYVDSGKVRYLFADFPLEFHSQAMPAAIAASCAHQQGSFWKMHDLLFENQNALQEQKILKLAGDLNLDSDRFTKCLKDPESAAQIRAHVALGEAAGIQGTPAFVVGRIRNGVLVDAKILSGAQPLSSFQRILEPLLAAGDSVGN